MRKLVVISSIIFTLGVLSGCSKNEMENSTVESSSESLDSINEIDEIENTEELNSNENTIITNPNIPQYHDAILKVPSEQGKYDALEDLIIKTWDIPNDYLAETYYYYNFFDFNNDGKDEIFVYVMGPYTSGSGGSSAFIVTVSEDNTFEDIQTFSVINSPIIISDELTNNFHDIIVYYSGGGAEGSYVKLKYENGGYPNVADGIAIETIDDISGSSIIYNDFPLDQSNGTVNHLK